MMTLRGFCLVLTTVLLAHFAQGSSVSSDRSGVRIVIALCVVFSLLGKLCAVTATVRYRVASSAQAYDWFEARRTMIEWLWVGSLPWAMTASGWIGNMAYLDREGWAQSALLALWFAPTLAFLLALDFSTAQLQEYFSSQRSTGQRSSLSRRWAARVRLGGTGAVIMCLVPVLLVVGCIDVLHQWAPHLSSQTRSLCAVCILGVVCLTLSPVWMRAWMGARPFGANATAPARVAEFCRQLQLRTPAVLCISGTGGWHGAALVGWVPPTRHLWIGAAVEEQLPSEELDMLILHELAHLRRGHCWWRISALLMCGICMVWGAAGDWLVWGAAEHAGVQWQVWFERSSLLALGGTLLWALSWTSRQCELDADRDACRQAMHLCPWAADRPDRAAAALVSALERMQGPHSSKEQSFWLHPSLAQRTLALQRQTSLA